MKTRRSVEKGEPSSVTVVSRVLLNVFSQSKKTLLMLQCFHLDEGCLMIQIQIHVRFTWGLGAWPVFSWPSLPWGVDNKPGSLARHHSGGRSSQLAKCTRRTVAEEVTTGESSGSPTTSQQANKRPRTEHCSRARTNQKQMIVTWICQNWCIDFSKLPWVPCVFRNVYGIGPPLLLSKKNQCFQNRLTIF